MAAGRAVPEVVWENRDIEFEDRDGKVFRGSTMVATHPEGVDHVYVEGQCVCGAIELNT